MAEKLRMLENPLAIAISGNAGAGKSTVSTAVAQRLGADTVFNTGRVYRSIATILDREGIAPGNLGSIKSFARSINSVGQVGFGDDQFTEVGVGLSDVYRLYPVVDGLHSVQTSNLVPLYASNPDIREVVGGIESETAINVLQDGWTESGSHTFVSEGRNVYEVLTTGGVPEDWILSAFLSVSDRVAAQRRQGEAQFQDMNLEEIEQAIADRNALDTQRAHGSYGFVEGRDYKIDTDCTTAAGVAEEIVNLALAT